MMAIIPRSSWISGVAAAGSGLLACALVAGLLDQILPTLPKVSLSLAGIPGLLVGLGAAYGVWWVTQVALQSASWADFRELLLKTLSPFDPADHGGRPRQSEVDPRPPAPRPKPERALRHKLRQLQSQVTTLKIELERQGIRLQQSEAERAQLQQQQQKLQRLLHCTKSENQKLRSQQEEWARQLEQSQQELRTLRESYRALQTLWEISSTLTPKTTASEIAAAELSGTSG